MSPDQGLEALLEGSNHNSDYQTVSKFDNLISPISSSKGARSQSLKRSRERSKTALAPLLLLDHRRTTARRPYISPDHRRTTSRRPYTPPDHQPKALHFAGPPAEGPTLRRTTAGPPAEGPTLRRTTAGPPPEGPTLRSRPEVQPKALHPAQGPKFSLRPYSPFKARCPA
ncbi:hypothetical protein M5K25_021434 [Dendrobium thyrsiflorum]|uniref:Uncharacterized protein n=1 Tax=Dendrobium thyrsiflorum TaxID=117978 RepID=A0ABD0UCL9_DENTH